MASGMHHQNVEPRNVIGRHQHGAWCRMAFDAHLNADDRQHATRPFLNVTGLLIVAVTGKLGKNVPIRHQDAPDDAHKLHEG